MTTIAYKNGVLAADSLMTGGGTRWGEVSKIATTPYGAIGGATGKADTAALFLDWLRNHCFASAPTHAGLLPLVGDEDADGIVVEPDGSIWCWCGKPILFRLETPFTAIGSGYRFAMAAMEMGASAEDAVKMAAKFDIYTGGRITTLSLPSPSRPTGR